MDGLRAFCDPENSDSSVVEKAYQRYALTQPDGVEVMWFQGYKSSFTIPVEEARRRYLEDEETMFCKFSGHELAMNAKMRIIARAVWRIEKQPAAVKRPDTFPLVALRWSEDEERQELETEQRWWNSLLESDPVLSDTVSRMLGPDKD